MLVLGLILILLSAGSLVAVVASGTDDRAMLYGGSLNLPTLVFFLAGAVAMLLFLLGLGLVRSGIRRANENRRNKKRLRKLEQREELRRDGAADGATIASGTSAAPPATTPEAGATPEAGPTPPGEAPQGGTVADRPDETPPPPADR